METTRIQKFGHLIVLDLDLKIIGFSHHLFSKLSIPVENILHSSAEDLFKKIFITISSYNKVKKLIESYIDGNAPRSLITVKINNKPYYLKVSKHANHIYIEAERQVKKHISTSDLNEIGFLFDSNHHKNWKLVCKAINKIIQFDRVFVLQVLETGNCSIIAENSHIPTEPLENKYFSKDFLPEMLIDHFRHSPYRFLANGDEPLQNFYTIDQDIDIRSTQLISLPSVTSEYYQHIGIKSALFFPLYLKGQFWGMVVAQNIKNKPVDLQNRKICTFIVQNAMSKYEMFIQQGLININLQVQEFQNTLIQRLSFHKTINCALVESMENLRWMLKSDGIAIYNEGDFYFKGETPSSSVCFEIIRYLQEENDLTVYIDHNFKKSHKDKFKEELPFAGILAYNVDTNKDYYIIWFRKETISNESKLLIKETSPYTFETYEDIIYETAVPWNDEELHLLDGLKNTLNHSMMQKLIENKDLTKNLSQLNNELEMFTYTLSHDLKNPLSVLKMGIDFLKSKNGNINENQKEKWFSTISLGLQNIQDIIDNIVNVSKDKVNKITKDTVPLHYLLRKIVEETKLAYEDNKCEVTFGKLLPVWGEKSAIYQIFTNVISNAIKYSQQLESPKIHVSSSIVDNYICYEVRDNGIGIPEQDISHIFEMFGRAMNTENYKGSGIGLSLVKRIIERLDGNIEISSLEGVGTTVIMKFPVVREFPEVMLDTSDSKG
ncbi:ATP-binding protein [Sphingobacterium composti Ten et al. 2007 non Yoo et al. 2007]|uniref:ATP-binding protein n=1 Tax=Sphingobacterium composti TaxID=363260 RepID=UPI001357EA2D|nr:ATP-binding protein [Sphingobacterium composti Ten et al. 2007 non Yoo et al. 2007]